MTFFVFARMLRALAGVFALLRIRAVQFIPPFIYNTMRKQVVLEGLLLQEQMGYSVGRGFINFLLSKEIVEVEIDDYSKDSVIHDLGQMWELLEAERFPEKTGYPNKCRDCCFRNYC